ncbi:hypothetical protein DLD77_02050 [Chitinophaga alhagiae]|uniref:DUF819 family protein n=1 Tax=Chitinophaga alhagiae TaxID=2203219 RepID=A0ABN5LMH5_9BACT|nr:DUF819 family protein [Chitinophaga alhagiae]AWO00570.1 hypothetical protein DLD77_02050 [Chitinophaga alhagiae]
MEQHPLITNDAVVFGLLMSILALIFGTSRMNHPFFRRLYGIIPPILLCYFIPGLLNTFGVISGSRSALYSVASGYLLPACLVLFTLGLDLEAVWKLRHKAGIMFLTASISVLIGGPLAVMIVGAVNPGIVGGEGPEAAWRGLATLAGTWIGGGPNQAAMYKVFQPSASLFSAVVALDVIIAYGWMTLMLFAAGKKEKIDALFKADPQIVKDLTTRMEAREEGSRRIPELTDTMLILGVGAGATGLAHWLADIITPWIAANAPYLEKFSLTSGFFWLILIASMLGLLLSFTKARTLEGAGASRIGNVFLYFLIATIGMQMDIYAIFNRPGLLVVGLVWIGIHGLLLLLVGKLIKAPFFFIAVGSMSNIGGPASASVAAAAFHTSLVPVAVLLAVCGYAIGTYAAYLCGLLMQAVTP